MIQNTNDLITVPATVGKLCVYASSQLGPCCRVWGLCNLQCLTEEEEEEEEEEDDEEEKKEEEGRSYFICQQGLIGPC